MTISLGRTHARLDGLSDLILRRNLFQRLANSFLLRRLGNDENAIAIPKKDISGPNRHAVNLDGQAEIDDLAALALILRIRAA